MIRAHLQQASSPARQTKRHRKRKLKALLRAGRRVVALWEQGDLAGAVRDLDNVLRRFKQ